LIERAQDNLAAILDTAADAAQLCSILLGMLQSSPENLTVLQYTFTRIEEIFGLGAEEDDAHREAYGTKNARYFTKDGVHAIDAPFIRALSHPDGYVQRSAANGYAYLLTATVGNVAPLIDWINSKLVTDELGIWDSVLPILATVSRSSEARKIFIKADGIRLIIAKLIRLGTGGNAQFLYQLLFVMWTLTLDPTEDLSPFLSTGSIKVLADFLASAPSRKVLRMAAAGLRNLAGTENGQVLTEMLTVGVDKTIDSIMSSNAFKQSADPEMESDLKVLHEILLRNYRELSTFECWASEVQSGALRWVPLGTIYTNSKYNTNLIFPPQGFCCLARAGLCKCVVVSFYF
jgi:V-ATPase subunit H